MTAPCETKLQHATTLAAFAVLTVLVSAPLPLRAATPPEWVPRLTGWTGDLDGNFIDDRIDQADSGITHFDVVLDLNGEPSPADLADFAVYGNVAYVARMLTVVILDDVPRYALANLVTHPRLAMIEQQALVEPTLNIGSRAVRGLASVTFSPFTARDIGLDGAGVTIAVMDTGIDNEGGAGVTHSAFPAARNAAPVGGFDGCVGAGVYVDPDDTTFHGTHVAGIALGGAYVDAGSGILLEGVASAAQYADIKVCCGGTCPYAAIFAGFDAAVDNREAWGIRVVNMSFGGSCGSTNGLDALSMAASSLADVGIVPVAAAGNSGAIGICSPCAGDNVICVASGSDLGTIALGDDVISGFSSLGPRDDDGDADPLDELKPDIAAPGSFILAPAFGTVAGSLELSGTSMASPHAAGVAALVLESRPGWTPADVKAALKATAFDKGGVSFPALDPFYDTAFGQGIVDAHDAATLCFGDLDCQDGDLCNGAEACVGGACVPGNPPDCDDGDPCTGDACDPVLGCVVVPAPDAEVARGPDGICDTADDNVVLFGGDGVCGTANDTCGDGVSGPADLCPDQVDPGQEDRDGDGIGDACDPSPCSPVPPGTRILSAQAGATGLLGSGPATVAIQVTSLTGFSVTSADLSLRFSPSLLSVSAVAAGPVAAGCTVLHNAGPGIAVISVSCPAPMSGAGNLALVSFNLLGSFDEASPLLLASAMLNQGAPAVCMEHGDLTLVEDADIGGALRYYRDGVSATEPGALPVSGALLALTGTGPGSPDSATSLADGTYLLPTKRLGEDYSVAAGKVGDFGGAISSYDAALNAQAVVGLIELTSAQLLAADVSGNGRNTSYDSSLIAQLAVGLIPRFPVGILNASDWFAVPAPAPQPNQSTSPPIPSAGIPGSIAYQPLAQAASGQDFLAGLFGDVSGNWPGGGAGFAAAASESLEAAEVPVTPEPADLDASDGARLLVQGGFAAPGQRIEIPITVENAEGAIAFDLELRYRGAIVRPRAARLGPDAAGFTLTANLETPGRVRLGIYGAAPLGGSGTIAIVSFEVISGALSATPLRLTGQVNEGNLAASGSTSGVMVRPSRAGGSARP